MSQFDDAQMLAAHSEARAERLRALHKQCLTEKSVNPEFLIEVKNFMENLRSALDYCARGLFAKYGRSSKPNPSVYFPYAKPPGDKARFRAEIVARDKARFRDETVARSIPGLPASRPDIVEMLETYQYFGSTGNWLPLFMRITNEYKHEQLTPQIERQYTAVRISGTIPPGGTVKIDPKNIRLGGGPGAPFHAVAGTWTGLEFTGTEVLVMPLLEQTLQNVIRIVAELSVA